MAWKLISDSSKTNENNNLYKNSSISIGFINIKLFLKNNYAKLNKIDGKKIMLNINTSDMKTNPQIQLRSNKKLQQRYY